MCLDQSQLEESDFLLPPEPTTDVGPLTDSEIPEVDDGLIVVALIQEGFLTDRHHQEWLPYIVECRKNVPGSKINL